MQILGRWTSVKRRTGIEWLKEWVEKQWIRPLGCPVKHGNIVIFGCTRKVKTGGWLRHPNTPNKYINVGHIYTTDQESAF